MVNGESALVLFSGGQDSTVCLAWALQRFARLNHGLVMASGFLSLAFGLFLCYQVGFVDGLFTGRLNWTPR